MKVLNLYAGIGGNRKLWKDVEVTAIENEYGFNLSKYNFGILKKRRLLRNCVVPDLGLHIFNCAYKEKQMILQ